MNMFDDIAIACYKNAKIQNKVTIPNSGMNDFLPKPIQSRDIVDARIRSLNFYKETCRMANSIIFKHDLKAYFNSMQLKCIFARYFRDHSNCTNPAVIDNDIAKGREYFMRVISMDADEQEVQKMLVGTSADGYRPNNFTGKNILKEDKLKGKSGFLKGFYSNDNSLDPPK